MGEQANAGEMAEETPSQRVRDILDTGARLFAEKGYDATSMRDISNAAGVSKALLYHHFSSKDDIYARIAFFRHAAPECLRECEDSGRRYGGGETARFHGVGGEILLRTSFGPGSRPAMPSGPIPTSGSPTCGLPVVGSSKTASGISFAKAWHPANSTISIRRAPGA